MKGRTPKTHRERSEGITRTLIIRKEIKVSLLQDTARIFRSFNKRRWNPCGPKEDKSGKRMGTSAKR